MKKKMKKKKKKKEKKRYSKGHLYNIIFTRFKRNENGKKKE